MFAGIESPASEMEMLLFTTVRLTVEKTAGEVAWGTGFFIQVQPKTCEQRLTILVTNKHVIEKSVRGSFRLHKPQVSTGKKPLLSGDAACFAIDDFRRKWIYHPIASVDLCGMVIHPPRYAGFALGGNDVYIAPLDDRLHFPADEQLEDLDVGQDVFMVGYPNALWDSVNNYPLVRRGLTATPLAVDFEGKPQFVIDMACFPGSSGSPVVLGNMYRRKTATKAPFKRTPVLLGVLHAGPHMSATGEIRIESIPTSAKPIAVTQLMMHLGYVIKTREIITLADHIGQKVQGT